MTRKENNRPREAAHFPAFDMEAPHSPPAAHVNDSGLTPQQALLKRLSETYGPSGSEENVRQVVRAEIKGLADQVRTDALGNLIALRKGNGNGRKKIMFAAPLDEIGVMVTFVDSRGFARFGMLGAVKPVALLGARCRFENGTIGTFGREPHDASRTEIQTEAMFLDVGAASATDAPVQIGEAACFIGEVQANGETLSGKALGGRASCAVLIETLRHLKKSAHDVYFVFTAQHQVGARGAGAAAFAIQPDYAFVVQPVPAHDIPGGENPVRALGKGPVILVQDDEVIVTGTVRELVMQTARSAQIAYQLQVRAHAGGDGTPIQATGAGIVTGIIGLPTRYLNTPSEKIDLRDVTSTQELLANLLASKNL